MKSIYKVGAVLAVLSVALASCSRSPDAATAASAGDWVEAAGELDPIAVEVVEVKWSTLESDIYANGLIRGSHEVTVVTETQGVIQDVSFTLGEAVEKDDVLVSFDDTIERLTVNQARETLSSAELDVASVKRLAETGNASQLELNRARSALAGAQAQLALAEKALEDRTVKAPIAGLVASVDNAIQRGNSVSRGIRVARIIDTTELEVVLSIGEREIRYLEPGARAFIRFDAAGSTEIQGWIHAIAAGSDPATGSFPVVVRWVNTLGGTARAGMSASVRIPPFGSTVAISVPVNAILTDGDQSYIYVAEQGMAVRKTVGFGDQVGDRVVVISGLAEGEQVIVSALPSLSDQTPVATTRVDSGR